MATLLLSAAGASLGGAVGGSVLGLSMTAVGRFAGAMIGNAIDNRQLGGGGDIQQSVIGGGSQTVETGQMNRFRLTTAGEGKPIGQVFGRMRVAGQMIWSTEFEEQVYTNTGTQTSVQTQSQASQSGRGGKGGSGSPSRVTTTTTTNNTTVTMNYVYSISIAVAVCEGEISSIGRIWADGVELDPGNLNMRVYTGAPDQLPDPKIEAIEGIGKVPAYRGTAYVVFENLQLADFGNRVPQFTFEVIRGGTASLPDAAREVTEGIQAVALMPGTGEFALATTPVNYDLDIGAKQPANINTPYIKSDLHTSLRSLQQELPNCKSTSLIVSWFGGDLRCGSCQVKPKVEQSSFEGDRLRWSVAGLDRAGAEAVPRLDGRPAYGGTPADASVVEAIHALNSAGQSVMFYPFILMDQLESNTLPDPWSESEAQPALPWRGRITTSKAPGQAGSPDGSAQAVAEVAQFFGSASASDFSISGGSVTYTGANDWGFRRFILHNAALCKAAGGVAAFCIGSELRGVTQIQGPGHSFPAVEALRALAVEVRALLGPSSKIGYAADWSEYFGYTPQDGSGNHFFHLDPLWADENIDFIGIDNYMPLSDWRDSDTHLDAEFGSIYDLAYLQKNIEGGEGYEWYYHSNEAEAAQIRTPITDGAYNEPWVFRNKDIRSWWSNSHHNRIGGVREAAATDWQPESKPIWFTEYGCAAIDKGSNQPNKFVDEKSSESSLPKHSNGQRDELMQMQYLRAVQTYWDDPERNPVSKAYGGQMLDMSRAFVWAWDARPYPFFPNRVDLWSDGENYWRGHWLNGRSSARSLASVVAEICIQAGEDRFDVSALYGFVRGYHLSAVASARNALQPLMLRYGFDAIEKDGMLTFEMRDGQNDITLEAGHLAQHPDLESEVELQRGSQAELPGRVRMSFVQADADYDVVQEECVQPNECNLSVSTSDLPLAMTRAEARQTLERWLSEARISQESVRFAVAPSKMSISAGDIIRLPGEQSDTQYRVDRTEQGVSNLIEAVRIEPNVYNSAPFTDTANSVRPYVPAVPVYPLFLDLPLMSGDEDPYAPHLAVTSDPWPGGVALYDAPFDADYGFNTYAAGRATIGVTQSPLEKASSGIVDRGAAVAVKLISGHLESISTAALFAGGNLAAIGDGSPNNWEIVQFQDAELIAPQTYALTNRLRGLKGTDAFSPPSWPEGSHFVLLNGVPNQIGFRRQDRGVERHYRIGPMSRSYDDLSFSHFAHRFQGIGLRPLSPVHLRVTSQGNDLEFSWIRRGRIDADIWSEQDIPLAETNEQYHVQILVGGIVKRDEFIVNPSWSYTQSMRALDGVETPFELRVAQVSEAYGDGGFAQMTVHT